VRYANFDLWVDLESGVLRIRARQQDGKGMALRSKAPPSLAEMTRHELVELSRSVREVIPSDGPAPVTAREVGGELFRAVFRKGILGLWYAALDQAGKNVSGVRLRLHLGPELWDWPWEWLFDEHMGYLAHFTAPPVSIVRYIDEATPPPPWREVPRIRILVVAAQPEGREVLDVEKEWCEIQRGLAGLRRWGRVHLEKLEHPTLFRLADKLASETFHVLHFIGHGGFNADGEGVLCFEDEQGGPAAVNGLQLGAVLKQERSLRLVILNACEGARDGDIPFAGVAQSLVLHQIPAVIAMKNPIGDEDAIRFSRSFYAGLARGGPVDRALSRALIGLLAGKPGGEWSTPVLYLRVPDGVLFPPPWKLIATFVLSLLLVAFAFATPSLIDPEPPPYNGPPSPSLPATASRVGRMRRTSPGSFTVAGLTGRISTAAAAPKLPAMPSAVRFSRSWMSARIRGSKERMVPSRRTSSPMTFACVPPRIRPKVTTAGAVARFTWRLTIVWTAFTI